MLRRSRKAKAEGTVFHCIVTASKCWSSLIDDGLGNVEMRSACFDELRFAPKFENSSQLYLGKMAFVNLQHRS